MRPYIGSMLLGGANPFTAAASPGSLSATGANGATETTASTTVTPTGPAGFTYSYSWVRLSGSTLISATSPSSATTTFSGVAPNNSTISATFRCTVTRSDGYAVTADVSVSLTAAVPPMSILVDSGSSDFLNTPSGSAWTENPSLAISNGFPAYTYSWNVLGTGASITGAATATPTVTVASQASGSNTTVTIQCTVTDSHSQVANSSQTHNLHWT